MASFLGKKYETRRMTRDDVILGAIVRIEHGLTVRRVVGNDGDEVILRGLRSRDVLEAVEMGSLVEQWVLLVPEEP